MTIENVVVKFIADFKDFNIAMGKSVPEMRKVFDKTTEQVKKSKQEFMSFGTKTGFAFRKAMHGLRGFKMELLSVMFGAQMVAGAMFGLIRPALEAVGFFDLLGATLQLLFIPVAMALLELLLPLFTWVMNWSDATKMMVGKVVLLVAGLATLLAIGASLMLFVGGMILVFSGLFNIIAKLIPDIDILGVNMSSFIEAGLMFSVVTALFDTFKGIVNTVLGKLLELDFIVDLFNALGVSIDDNKTALENFKALAVGAWNKIKEQIGLNTDALGEGGLLGSFKSLFPSIEDITKKVAEIKKEFKIDEMTASLTSLSKSLEDLVPSMTQIARLAHHIANALEMASSAWQNLKGFSEGSGYSIKDRYTSSNSSQSNTQNNNISMYGQSNMNTDELLRKLNQTWTDQFVGMSRQ